MSQNILILIVAAIALLLLVVLMLVIFKKRPTANTTTLSQDKKTVYSLSPSDVVTPNPVTMKQLQEDEENKPYNNN